METFKVFCDGSGFNNVSSAYCIIIPEWKRKVKNRKKYLKGKKEVKVIYENKAVYEIEYLALIGALELCESLSKDGLKFNIYSDSRCIVSEVNLKNKPKKKKFFNQAREILKRNSNFSVEWISREENPAGKYLEKRLERIHNYAIGCFRRRHHGRK